MVIMRFKNQFPASLLIVSLVLMVFIGIVLFFWLDRLKGTEERQLHGGLANGAERIQSEVALEFAAIAALFTYAVEDKDIVEPFRGLLKSFPDVYGKWKVGTRFPDLIDTVYFVSHEAESGPLILRYVEDEERFFRDAGTGPDSKLKQDVSWLNDGNGTYRIVSDNNSLALVVPIERYEQQEQLKESKKEKFNPVFAGHLLVLLAREYFAGELVAGLFETYLGSRAGTFSFAVFDENSDDVLYSSPNTEKTASKRIAARRIDTIVPLTAWISAENSLLTDVLGAAEGEASALPQSALSARIKDLFIRQWFVLKSRYPEKDNSDPMVFGESGQASIEAAQDLDRAKAERAGQNEGINLYIWHSSGSIEKAARSERNRLLAIAYSVLICFALLAVIYYLLYRRAKNLRDREHEFVATVTHELRTPVTAINAAADNLTEGIIRDPALVGEYGKAIIDQGRRLRVLIDQILQYAGLSGTKKNSRSEPIQLDEFVRDVTSRVSGMARGRLIVHVQANLPVYSGDKIAVETVITNLLSNAAKHAGETATVTLNVNRETARTRSWLVIRVSDSGKGIPKRELGKITEPFYRGETSRANQVPGSGLGLSLVRRIVQTYRGTLSIDSAANRGTIVTVRLPFEPDVTNE